MEVQGACLCGACAWEAEIDPQRVFVCHCEDCQVQGGSAFRSIAVTTTDRFRLTRGALRTYVKTAASGASRELAFCPDCGTHVYGGPGRGEQGVLSLRVGGLAQRRELAPSAQLWCRSRLEWLDDLSDVPRLQTQPGAPESGEEGA